MAVVDTYQIAGLVSTVEQRYAVLGVTDNWRVEINGQPSDYTNTQAVCIAGLLTALDTPITLSNFRDIIRGYFNGSSQPEAQVADFEQRKLETILGRIGNVASPIQGNYFRLGKSPHKVTVLASRVGDCLYQSVEQYYRDNPSLGHLGHTALGTLRTQLMDRHRKNGLATSQRTDLSRRKSNLEDFTELINAENIAALLRGF